jgi:hypothetical protein
VADIDFEATKRFVESKIGRMLDDLNNPYEDPAFILLARTFLDSVLDEALWGDGYIIPLKPFVAGMPSLGMNPVTRAFVTTGESVILLQNSMLNYLAHFASATTALLPQDWFPRSREVTSSPSERPSLDLTLEAHEHLRESLAAYVIDGTPRDVGHMALAGPINQWRSNLFGCATKFVLAHEVAHIMAGHLTSTPARTRDERWAREYDADYIGMMAVISSGARGGVDLQTSLAGCILTLLATDTVDVVVHLLQHGTTEVAHSPTHPLAIDRAARLVKRSAAELDQHAGRQLRDEVFARLEEMGSMVAALVAHCIGVFARQYEAGVRPAEIWRLQAPPE